MRLSDLTWLAGGVTLNAMAQLALKSATRATGRIEGSGSALAQAIQNLAVTPSFWFALCAYGLSVGVWIVGLSRVPVSQAYPVLSLGYVLTAILAWPLLGETVSPQRWLGIAVIVFGVWLIARN